MNGTNVQQPYTRLVKIVDTTGASLVPATNFDNCAAALFFRIIFGNLTFIFPILATSDGGGGCAFFDNCKSLSTNPIVKLQ